MTIRVVIVDDHPVFREGLRFTLERHDDISVVAEAGDGAEGLDLVRMHQPDVILMDLAMPVLDGLAAISRLRAEGATTPVLVLTMTEGDAAVFAAIRAGAQGYLVKGVAPDQVVNAVRAASAGHAVFGPTIASRMLAFFAEPRGDTRARFGALSPREAEVLELLAAGKSNQQIAQQLVISSVTARNHVSSILAKLQVANRREAMLRYQQPDSG